jgi:hypothetical protein
MFAPPIAKKPMAAASSSTVKRRHSNAANRQAHTDDKNLWQRGGEALTGPVPSEAGRLSDQTQMLLREAGPSWDFSSIPVFAPDRPPTFSPLRLWAKLAIGAVNDPLEQEADRVAEQVTQMTAAEVAPISAPAKISRKCAACEAEEEKLQKKEAVPGEAPVSVLDVLRSPGQPLDEASRAYFEPRFRQDFSRVRVHSDAAAEQSARDVNANAYTAGHDMVFGTGRFAPGTHEGRRLLAHELTHVVQRSAEDPPRALTRQPTDATHRGQNAKPQAPKCDTGLALRWGRETTCSKWGFFEGVHEQGEGKKWRSFNCCNSWPLSLEYYARNQGLNGAASCKVQHEREIATITLGDKEAEVLCSDTIPTDKSQVIEMSPKAMQDLSGQVANPLQVSVCYSGSKQDLCLHNGPGAKSFPTVSQCLTRGCPITEGTPSHADSGWPRV